MIVFMGFEEKEGKESIWSCGKGKRTEFFSSDGA